MSALVALPTARPSCADDSDDRTQFFRPNQKRPTWKDVERARAAAAPVRLAPALQLVPRLDTRGSSRTPAAKHVPPYLKPGYVFSEALTIEQKRAQDTKSCQEGLQRIRPTPKNLAALLKMPEWKGARIEGAATEEEIAWKRADIARAERRLSRAQSQHEQKLAQMDVGEQKACLARMLSPETLRVIHPSGSVLFWRPTK